MGDLVDAARAASNELERRETALHSAAARVGTDVERMRESVRIISETTPRTWWEALDEMAAAMERTDALWLDNLGIVVKVRSAEPTAEAIAHFERVYGNQERAEATARAIARLCSMREFQRSAFEAAQATAS